MEGKKINESEFERKRSHSVPILSQIEKVLDRRDDFEAAIFERETSSERNASSPETRSPRNTIPQKERRLSSGGLIRNQKRRHLKTALMEVKQTSRPRACSTTETTTKLHEDGQYRDIVRLDLHAIHAHRRERSKSLPLIQHNYAQNETNEEEIGCVTQKQKQTAKTTFYNQMLHRSLSLPALQHESAEHSETEETGRLDMIKPLILGPLHRDHKPDSLIVDFDQLSFNSLQQSKQERKDTSFSDLGRRRSLPCRLEKRNLSVESSGQNINFNNECRVDSVSHKAKKMKTQRSQSLPLTSSSFVGVKVEKMMMRDEVSRAMNHSQGYCGFRPRDALSEIVLANEHSQLKEKHPKTRSKSLPLALDVEGETNMSPNLLKHIKQKSLQSHDRLHDVKGKRRRVKSLPFIYERFSERELLCEAQITHHSQIEGSDSIQKVKSDEETKINDNGNIKQNAQLERARSLPLSLAGGPQRSRIAHIQEDLNTAIDVFFSQIDEERQDVGCRKRSKSLPNVLEGVHSLNFTPVVTKLLEDNNDISEIVIAEDSINDTVDDVESEYKSDNESKRSFTQSSTEQDKNGPNEESRSDTSLDCDDLHQTAIDGMRQTNSTYPAHKLPARPRGFSVPNSFKMEKIIEEPNETSENSEKITMSACSEHGRHSEENKTNSNCKEGFIENNTMTCKPPAENFTVSRNHTDVFLYDKTGGTPEGNEAFTHEHSLARFNNIVTEALASLQQLEFSKSSSGLHRAAANGDLECVKRLVEGGDDVNGIDESGWPVLHAAVTTGNFDCGAWLIEAGADLANYTNFVIDEYRMLSRQVYQN